MADQTRLLQEAPHHVRPFFANLESARGIAALMVAAFHASEMPSSGAGGMRPLILAAPDSPLQPLDAAYTWFLQAHEAAIATPVLFFFVLSGFVLSHSLTRTGRDTARSALQFAVARIFRIYPAVFATILIFWLTYLSTGRTTAPPDTYAGISLIENALLLIATIEFATWTLQTELIATIPIFAANILHGRFGIIAVAGVALILTLLAFWGRWNAINAGGPPHLHFQFAFVFGVLAYHVGPRKPAPSSQRVLLSASVTLMFAAQPLFGKMSNWTGVIAAVAAAVAINLLAFATPARVNLILGHPLLRFHGRISYSYYLLHTLAFAFVQPPPDALGRLVSAGIPPTVLAIGIWIAATAVITPVAWLVHRYVERPGIAAGRTLAARLDLSASGQKAIVSDHVPR